MWKGWNLLLLQLLTLNKEGNVINNLHGFYTIEPPDFNSDVHSARIKLEHICDIDGDRNVEIILTKEKEAWVDYSVLKFSNEFSTVTEQEFTMLISE